MIKLTKEQAEIIMQALSSAATDDMRYAAWDVLNAAIKQAAR